MKTKVLENKKNQLRIQASGFTHESLKLVEEELLNRKDVSFAAYKREHFLKDEYIFLIRTINKDPKAVFNLAVKNAAKKVKDLKVQVLKLI